jgi:cytochrome c oxidase subunit II
MRIVQFTLFCLLLASQAAQAEFQFNMPLGVTPVSHDIYHLHMTIFWVCVVIGIAVFGVMFYAMIYHRKSRHPKPAQFHEHLWVEIAWSIIPLFILIAMAVPASKVLIDMSNYDKADITIKVTGYQWKWRYEYLDNQINFFSTIATPFDQMHGTAPKDANYLREVDHPLVVPIHKKIRFLFTSNDVIHSWWVQNLGVKRDSVPGFISEGWARINRPGTYYGQCAELCGMNHAYMPIVVVAMNEKDFNDWVAQQKGEKVSAQTPAPNAAPTDTAAKPASTTTEKKLSLDELKKRGEQVYMTTCSACHMPTGVGLPPTFPALKGSVIVKGPLADHMNRVMNGKAGTAMQAFKDQLNDDDLAAVITYERNGLGE